MRYFCYDEEQQESFEVDVDRDCLFGFPQSNSYTIEKLRAEDEKPGDRFCDACYTWQQNGWQVDVIRLGTAFNQYTYRSLARAHGKLTADQWWALEVETKINRLNNQ